MRLGGFYLRNSVVLGLLSFASAPVFAAEDSFLRDSASGMQLRSLYFRRDLPGGRIQETLAAGGWIWARTGYWRDFVSFGGTVAGAGPVYGPERRDGAGLLKQHQEGYAVVSEAYARFKYPDHLLTVFRQSISATAPQKAEGVRPLASDTNYLGARDLRMTPLTYKAALLNGVLSPSLRYQAGYVAKVKDLNSEHFVSMSRLAGVTGRDEGMWTGGLQWSPAKDFWAQAFYYHVKDTLRIAYADVDRVTRTSRESYHRLAAQYTDQRSEGANLLTRREFRTWNAAVYAEYGWRWLTAYAAVASTGRGQQIRTPYSFGPFFVTQRIKTFNRAGEDAVLLGTTFNFAAAGFAGLTLDVNAAEGRHAIDAASGAAQPRWREYDADLVYRFAKESVVPGMRVRFRWATVREYFPARIDRTDDLRFDVNWAITFH